jgi:hypothetical protein
VALPAYFGRLGGKREHVRCHRPLGSLGSLDWIQLSLRVDKSFEARPKSTMGGADHDVRVARRPGS